MNNFEHLSRRRRSIFHEDVGANICFSKFLLWHLKLAAQLNKSKKQNIKITRKVSIEKNETISKVKKEIMKKHFQWIPMLWFLWLCCFDIYQMKPSKGEEKASQRREKKKKRQPNERCVFIFWLRLSFACPFLMILWSFFNDSDFWIDYYAWFYRT